MSIKKTKPKKNVNKLQVWSVIISVIATFAIICLIIGITAILILLKDKPTINADDFQQQESSIVYDMNGDEIANLGNVIRQNVEYNEIPNCVIDAFVAIEDSRFFEHNGFDVPRFTMAMIKNLMSLSFDQGGSTFTMQLIKNTYYTDDETGTQASRSGMSGIKRKVQEIALALELSGQMSKQAVFESYVNKLNFGGDRNIRGIQKAAQYYFGKDISECTTVEGALLAGVINAPNYYNPFYNLDAATERTHEVLYQMYHHGYLSKTEYELALSVKVEDLLKDPYSSDSEGEGIPYQAYVDQVVSEVISLTGIDPYSTTMHIYTYMNPDIQKVMDNIQAENMDGYLTYPDEYFEVASVAVENSTGAIVGILGGRNYANGGQLLLNHATEQYKQPGSTMKPILDYALAFENLGWATDHVITDRPMYYDDVSKIIIINDSGTYEGDQTLKQAVGKSINTCAIQALEAVLQNKSYEYVVNYCQSLGYDFNLEDFNVQYAIGGSSCEVTPLQQASAYAAILNGGVYNTPHTIKRIEFTNGKSPITPTYESTQVISDAAAYLTTELMKSNVASYGGTYTYVKSDNYTVYAKTGTTDYGTTATEYGIPSGAIKDGWLVAGTSEYTTATWVGYEKAVLGQQSYITKDYYYNDRPQGKIAHLVLEALYEYGNTKPTTIAQPSSVTSITHIIGTFPYAVPVDGMDDSLITTGLIKKDSVKMVNLSAPTLADMSGEISISYSGGTLTVKWPEYPDTSSTAASMESRTKDISLRSSTGEVVVAATGTCLFDQSWIYGAVEYACDVTVNGNTSTYTSDDNSKTINLYLNGGDVVKVTGYYQYSLGGQKSSSSSKSITVTESVTIPDQNASKDTVSNWASRYSYVSYTEQEVSESNFRQYNTFTVRNQNGTTIPYGSAYTISSGSDRIDVVYYFKKDPNINAVQTDQGITASVDNLYGGSVTYSFNGNASDSNKYTPAEGETSLTISAHITYTDGSTADISKTVSIN
ncbi:MAG: transglycosylase domain-containing protein [Erysipelotrichaceae bacterium]|nr:transglycosylase domain-containing protein [Erysipelotrichaceae bacterium]